MRDLKRNRMNESEHISRKEVISYIKNLVGNYFYGEDEEGYLIIKCPSGSFRILIADDLGNGVIALEEMVERGVAPMEDEKAIARLLKRQGIIK